jgi:hypothetical protein
MNRRSFPLWLLRDVPAFLGFLLTFWPLMICVINSGGQAMRNGARGQRLHDRISIMLAHAEAWLCFALWRQAYRRVGWHPRSVKLQLIPPTTHRDETFERFRNYIHAFLNMEQVVDTYVEDIRARYRICKTDLVAHGSTDAALCATAHHELVSAASIFSRRAQLALILSSDQRERPSKDERGHAHARGPPLNLVQNQTNPPRRPHLRVRTLTPAPQKSARTATRKFRPVIGAISFSGEVCSRTSSSVRFLPSSIT